MLAKGYHYPTPAIGVHEENLALCLDFGTQLSWKEICFHFSLKFYVVHIYLKRHVPI